MGRSQGLLKCGRKEGGRGEVKEDEWRFIANPIFIESNANDKQPLAGLLQRPDYLIN